MTIYIVGASGLLGNCLYKRLKKKFKVKGTYSNNKIKGLTYFDLKKHSVNKINRSFNENDIIILLSAYTNPGWISKNKIKTRYLNIDCTKKFIKQLIKKKVKLVFMSSVEVFDGTKKYYYETDKPNPLNFYGKTKYEIEKYIKKNLTNYCIFRTSWNSGLFLHGRCVVELTYNTIMKKNAQMASDNIFSITHVNDTAKIIEKNLISNNKIIHVANNDVITRSDLAKKIKKLSKYKNKMNFKIVKYSNIKYSEPRSLRNILKSHYQLDKKFKFKKIIKIISHKVKLLDKIYS